MQPGERSKRPAMETGRTGTGPTKGRTGRGEEMVKGRKERGQTVQWEHIIQQLLATATATATAAAAASRPHQ